MSKQAKKKQKINKAGCVIMGRTGADEEISLLVPYNEGRFAQHGEYFVLPKGSVDKDEDVLRAALRETSEETGIDVVRLLCATQEEVSAYEADKANFIPEAVKCLMSGKAAKNMVSAGYAGVTVLKADPIPYRHDYLSRAGVKHRLALFRIEVDGIEKLAEHPDLKNNQRAQTRELIKDHAQRPKFPRFMNWMERGYIPIDAPEGHPEHDTREGSGQLVPLHPVEWFKGLVKEFAPEGRIIVRTGGDVGGVNWEASRQHWQEFCKNLPNSDYKQLSRSFQAIKSHLKKAGWLGDDNALLKFDEKDCPLFYYTEGARVVPVKEYLAKIFTDFERNPDYACAFGGQCEITKHLSPQRTITHSQFAAIGPFVEPVDYVEALDAAVKKNGDKKLSWQRGDCDPCKERPKTHIDPSDKVLDSLIATRASEVVRHTLRV